MKRHAAVALLTLVISLASSQVRAEQIGVPLPAPLAATLTQGGPPNFADTYLTPYVATHAGVIVQWNAQFAPGQFNNLPAVPAGLQLKILRQIPGTTLVQVVAEGALHDPRPVLQARFAAYPFFDSALAVVEFVDHLAVQAGDIIGVSYRANPDVGAYFNHLVAADTETRLVLRNVALGETIDLADPFTGTLPRLAPALEISSAIDVAIDIKPGSFPNSVNLGSAGSIPVAILSSEDVDATTVVPSTVTLEGAQVRLVGRGTSWGCASEDVNFDGRADLVCHVTTLSFRVGPGESVAVLEAETVDGRRIRGRDSIRIVP